MAYDQTEIEKLIEKLAAVYPQTFFLNQEQRRPLKIGVHHDLVADTAVHGLSDAELRRAVGQYCRSSGYSAAMVAGAERIDLAGGPAGFVSAEAVATAVKSARLQHVQRHPRREAKAEGEAVAIVVAPDQQKAAAPEPALDQTNRNGTRMSFSDLRIAAARRRLPGQPQC